MKSGGKEREVGEGKGRGGVKGKGRKNPTGSCLLVLLLVTATVSAAELAPNMLKATTEQVKRVLGASPVN